jgi:hypothetical protein
MEIRSSRSEGSARLELHGELDLGTAPELVEAVDAALGSPPGSEARVVIETSRTGSVVGLRDA